jgi:hypothetical protein
MLKTEHPVVVNTQGRCGGWFLCRDVGDVPSQLRLAKKSYSSHFHAEQMREGLSSAYLLRWQQQQPWSAK